MSDLASPVGPNRWALVENSELAEMALCRGFSRGMLQARPLSLACEEQILEELRRKDCAFLELIKAIKSCDNGESELRNDILRSSYSKGHELGVELRLEADLVAAQLHHFLFGGLRVVKGVQTLARMETALRLLFSLPKGLLILVCEAYPLRYGFGLEEAISRVYPEGRAQALLLLLEGKKSAALAVLLRRWLTRRRNPFQVCGFSAFLREGMEYLSEGEIADFQEQMRHIIFHRRTIEELIEVRFPEEMHLELRALLRGDFALAMLAELKRKLDWRFGFRAEECLPLIRKLANFPVDTLFATFEEFFGEDIKTFFLRKLRPGPFRDLALGILDRDLDLQNAASLRLALDGIEPGQIGELFLGKSEEQRAKVIQAYERAYPERNLRQHLKKNFRGIHREVLESLIVSGEVSLGRLLYLCVVGIGTDEEGLRNLLEGRVHSEIMTARVEFFCAWREHSPFYEKLFPRLFGSLDRRIWIETGGDTWFDLQAFVAISRNRDQGPFERAESIYKYERSGRFNRPLDFLSAEVDLVERDISNFRSTISLHRTVNWELEGLSLLSREEILLRYLEQDSDAYRRLKHYLGNLASDNTAKIATISSAIILSVSMVPIHEIIVIVAGLSVFTRLNTKLMIKGRAYSWEEVVGDLCFGVVDGLTLFCSRLVRKAFFGGGTGLVAKLGLRRGWFRLNRGFNRMRAESFGLDVVIENGSNTEPDVDPLEIWEKCKKLDL